MRYVSVVGNSGSGKSTLTRDLASALGVAHLELDDLKHQPNWEQRPNDEMRALVQSWIDEHPDGWVIDGNYRTIVQDLLWGEADTVVWLDLPRRVVMSRVVRRTLRRVLTREELWNGNREPWTNLYALDPEKSILRWAWTNHAKYRERYTAAARDPQWAHLGFVRITDEDDRRVILHQAAQSTALGAKTR